MGDYLTSLAYGAALKYWECHLTEERFNISEIRDRSTKTISWVVDDEELMEWIKLDC